MRCVVVCCSVIQCVAVCYSVLQYIAVCCSVLQCAAMRCSVLQCVAVCYSVLQRVAVSCSVLPCVAVCCIVLHCVAMCCSVLQCVAANAATKETESKVFVREQEHICTHLFAYNVTGHMSLTHTLRSAYVFCLSHAHFALCICVLSLSRTLCSLMHCV